LLSWVSISLNTHQKGFLNYASNMLKAESKKAGKATLGDDFIINKIRVLEYVC